MCGPTALLAVGTAVSIGGQLYSGVVASQNARYQEQVAAMNRDRANEQAVDALNRGHQEQRAHYRDVAATMGAQVARMSANGIDPGFGSAVDLVGDTAMLGEEDARTINENTFREMRGFEIDATNYEAERRAARSARRQVPVATALGVAQTALGGATQYARYSASRRAN